MLKMAPTQVRHLTQHWMQRLDPTLSGFDLKNALRNLMMKKIPRTSEPKAIVPGWYL